MGSFFSQPKPKKIKTLSTLPDADLAAFINKQSVIRIAVHGGGGFGHQAAAVTLMQRLRELGYKGRFHVVVPKWSTDSDRIGLNLAELFPGYDPRNRDSQEIGAITVDRYDISQEVLDFPPVGLTISPANDFDVIAVRDFVKFNSACHLSMQPTGWRYPTVWITDVMSQDRRHHIAENTVLFSETEARPSMESLSDSMISFLRKIALLKERGCLTQSLYGFNFEKKENPMYFPSSCLSLSVDYFNSRQRYVKTGWVNPNVELTRLIQGASEAQKILDKPITLLFHSPAEVISSAFSESPEIRRLQLSGKKIVFVNGTDKDPNSELDQYDGNTIIVWFTGPLPRDIFRQMLFDSDLPPVVEGANSTGLMEASRGYLHGGRARNDFWKIPDDYFTKHDVDLLLRRQHLAVNQLLEDGGAVDPCILGRFYLDVLEGKYDQYFAVCARYFRDERPDAVLNGIEALMRNPVLQKSFNETDLFKSFINLLKKDLDESYFNDQKVMNLVRRISLLKEKLHDSLDDTLLIKFQDIMGSVKHKLLTELAIKKHQSKVSEVYEVRSYREHLQFIQQIVFSDCHTDLGELEEQLIQSQSEDHSTGLRRSSP